MNSNVVENYQTFLYDIPNFTYDRVNYTFSFNYIINYYESYKDKQEYHLIKLNYHFKNIKIEASTIEVQQNNNGTLGKNIILPIIKFVEIQPNSVSISLLNCEVDSYISESLSESSINKNKLLCKIANTRLEATKKFNEIGKRNGNLTFSSLFDAFQQSDYHKENTNILMLNDTILFLSSNIDRFLNIVSNPIENLNLSTNCWSFLFVYDYYINLQELENNDNIVVEKHLLHQ